MNLDIISLTSLDLNTEICIIEVMANSSIISFFFNLDGMCIRLLNCIYTNLENYAAT